VGEEVTGRAGRRAGERAALPDPDQRQRDVVELRDRRRDGVVAQQRVARRAAAERGDGQRVQPPVEALGEAERELGRAGAGRQPGDRAADLHDRGPVLARLVLELLGHALQRRPPRHADGARPAHEVGQPARGGPRAGRRIAHDDGEVEPERLLQRPRALVVERDRLVDLEAHDALGQGVVEQAGDLEAAHVHPLGDLLLGHAVDVVHPGHVRQQQLAIHAHMSVHCHR
jgi:hypothetical protein